MQKNKQTPQSVVLNIYEGTSDIKGWETLHLYTQNGFCVPLAAVKISF